jgi:hypothetical protein
MNTTSGEGYPTPQEPSAGEVYETMRRILASRHFVNAPTKQKFLRLICESHLNGRASELNEYMIGCEIYDRDGSYNPATDPIVRVGAHDLRKRLEAYYKGIGKSDEIILDLPVGSYVPIFTRRQWAREGAGSAPAITAAPSAPSSFIEKHSKAMLNVAVVFLLMTTLMLAYSNTQLRLQSKASAQSRELNGAFKPIWETFMKSGNPALLVLGTPPVYRFRHPADPTSLSAARVELTPEEARVMEDMLSRERLIAADMPAPQLTLSYGEYACLGETIGLFRVTGLFDKMGKSLALKQSRRLTVEDLKNHDAILLGSSWVKEWLGNSPIRKCFTTGPGATIINQNILPGDEREYVARYDEETGRLIEDYATITVKPGISERRAIMVVAGMRSEGTQAAVEYLTDESYLAELNQKMLQTFGAFPKYFQILLKVSVDNGIPTNISAVRVREIRLKK